MQKEKGKKNMKKDHLCKLDKNAKHSYAEREGKKYEKGSSLQDVVYQSRSNAKNDFKSKDGVVIEDMSHNR